jgi:hypothetical protein
MRIFTATLTTLAAVACASSVLAVAPPRLAVSDLEAAQAKVSRQAAQTNKGGLQQRLLLEKERIQGLIDDLQTGKPVAPSEVDRALWNADNPGSY